MSISFCCPCFLFACRRDRVRIEGREFRTEIKVHGKRIKLSKLADDTVVLAEMKEDLEELLKEMSSLLTQEFSLKTKSRLKRNKSR